MKTIAILGSTGSIGTQALEIIDEHPDAFEVIGLAAGQNDRLFETQVKKYKPRQASLADEDALARIQAAHPDVEGLAGFKGLEAIAGMGADIVINAVVGSVGLSPTIAALKAGSIVAIANKETMVAGGEFILKMGEETLCRLIPVDSEHSAIFQCLQGEQVQEVRRILLTGSGGPFWKWTAEMIGKATPKEALNHPRWTMGPKITIDSATMMNKGLEVIEAHYLFGIGYENIEVVVHPESVIHSMVEFCDGSIKAHLGLTDMHIPIQYALSWPKRLESKLVGLDLAELGSLTFEKPDPERFPCLKLAYQCGRAGGTFPAVLNSANEEAVGEFLAGCISFSDIIEINQRVVDAHLPDQVRTMDDILAAERWARREAKKLIAAKS